MLPARRYYAARMQPGKVTLEGLYRKLQHLYLFFRDRDYFKAAGITRRDLPETVKHKAALSLSFEMFPVTKWPTYNVTEDHVFEAIEFLHDHVSRPGALVEMTSETGFNYSDYDGYDERVGRAKFRKEANAFLADYKSGFELTKDGIVLALGTDGSSTSWTQKSFLTTKSTWIVRCGMLSSNGETVICRLKKRRRPFERLLTSLNGLRRQRSSKRYWIARMSPQYSISPIISPCATTTQIRRQATTERSGTHGCSISTLPRTTR